MRNYKLTFLLAIVLSMMASHAVAYDAYIGGIYYYFHGDEAEVTYKSKYNSPYRGDIVIPSTVTYNGKSYSVTCIGSYAFAKCSGLTSIIIPESVTSIGNYAFSDCSGLTAINIPEGVTSIDDYAFQSCSGLTSITIPESVTSIGHYAFDCCSGLTIAEFASIESLCRIKFEDLHSNPLYYAHHLYIGGKEVTEVVISENVTSIGSSAFAGCSGLTSITIPKSVTSIGYEAFLFCSGLTSITVSPNNPNYDSHNNCNALIETKTNTLVQGCKNTIIPKGVTSIGDYAFSGCSSLTAITIPEGVTSIGICAFSGCSSLTAITIPEGVTSIGKYAFSGCSGLTVINIPEGVTSIGESAFSDCSGLTSITIPEGVTCIGDYAFSHCSGLTKAEFASIESLCKIEFSNNYANPLYYAHHLYIDGKEVTDVVIPKSVTSIGKYAFYGCSGLSSIVVDDKNPTYDSRYNCNAIIETRTNKLVQGCKNTTIPEGVTSIGEYAFASCSGLKAIIIPEGVTSIGDYAFSNCNCIFICNSNTPPNATGYSFSSSIALVPNDAVNSYNHANGWRNLRINEPFYCASTTQTTATLVTSELIDNPTVTFNGVTYIPTNDTIIIRGLSPNKGHTVKTSGSYQQESIKGSVSFTTRSIYPIIQVVQRTNLTITLQGSYDAGDAEVRSSGFEGHEGEDRISVDGLRPGQDYYCTYIVESSDGSRFTNDYIASTEPINLSVNARPSSTSCVLTGYYSNVIDATITGCGFIDGAEKNETIVTGLDPKKSYNYTFYVDSKEGGRQTWSGRFTTSGLTLTTLQPKVISVGNVIVGAESNIVSEEEKVGFEWRRTDWTDDFASNTGGAYIYEGMLEGYIRNLNAEKLWKFRPYYLSNSGTYYYGDWVGLDPSNTSYFEPTVHTYSKIEQKGNTALVKGYALRGTDNVVVQGFKYWKTVSGGAKAPSYGPQRVAVPRDATTVEAKGQVMTASLTDLDFDTEYCYVAFIETSEGETFYGEQQTFRTEIDTTPVISVEADASVATVVGRYDINGRRIDQPVRGVNILRMSDGTTRKVVVR